MGSYSHPCGNISISPCTQGVERPFPGNGRDGRVACQESTALSPRCAQMRGVYAHVIHRFLHRPAWLDAPGTTHTTSQAVSSRHRSLPHGGPRCWLSWATTGACCAPWPARTTDRQARQRSWLYRSRGRARWSRHTSTSHGHRPRSTARSHGSNRSMADGLPGRPRSI